MESPDETRWDQAAPDAEAAIAALADQSSVPMPSVAAVAVEDAPKPKGDRTSIYQAAHNYVDTTSEALLPEVIVTAPVEPRNEEVSIPIPRVGDTVKVGIAAGALIHTGIVTSIVGDGTRGRINVSVLPDKQPGVRCVESCNYYKDPRTVRRMATSGFEPLGRWAPNEQGTIHKLTLLVASLLDRVQTLEDGRA